MRFIVIAVFAVFLAVSSAAASGDMKKGEKAEVSEAMVTELEAVVKDVNHEARKVTLEGPDGNEVTIDVEDDVKNLAQVKVGDVVLVEYVEAVSIKVFDGDQIESGLTALSVEGSAELGEKPAGVAVDEIILVVAVKAIDKETQMVTLEGANGKTKTVKARNPENLEKVSVGDKIMITYTEAIGISVVAKP